MRYTTPRTKELGARIENFLKKLESIDSDKRIKTAKGYEAAVERACTIETQYWRDKLGLDVIKDADGISQRVHGSIHTLTSYFTDYRNAILDHYEGRMDDRNSYQQETGLTGNRRLVRHPIARRYFVKTAIESQAVSEQISESSWESSGDAPTVSRSAILEIAQKLLNSKSYIANAIGLIAVTGRRPTEILKTARFEKTGEFTAVFWGQLKTKGSELARDGYEITTLIPVDEVIEHLAKLRGKKDFSALENRDIEKKTAVQFEDMMRDNFFHLWRNPSAKDLRAIYAESLWTDYYATRMTRTANDTQRRFFANVLGHSEKDEKTANSYIRFFVTD